MPLKHASRVRRLISNPDLLRVHLRGQITRAYCNVKHFVRGGKPSDLRVFPIIWLRTPKCASSSVLAALESADRVVDLIKHKNVELTEDLLRRKMLCIGAAGKQGFIHRHPALWERATKWAIVRCPYQRALSAWRYLDHLRQRSFENVVANPPQKENDPAGFHHFTHGFHDMLSWDGKDVCDHVLKFENLDQELPALMEVFGVEFHGLPTINQTPGVRPRQDDLLGTELRQKLQVLFADDFRKFGYPH